MSRTSKNTLRVAKRFSNLLLFEASGGSMGSKPDGTRKTENITFAEKKAFLSELLKLADLEIKHKPEDDDESPFAAMKKGVKHGGKAAFDGGNKESGGEDTSDDPSEF
jgi:hypothetical protein